jgi:gliding motility-associated protein GldM
VGTKSIPVHITYKDQDGKDQVIDRLVTYTIGQSSAAISQPEMNVLYIGYPNKIVVSGGGVGAEKISINVSGGGANQQRTQPGEFIVNVSQQTDNCVIAAFADGKQIGALTYRVRQIPEATATVGGKKSGESVNAATLAAQGGVGAGIENFPLPLKYTVARFQVVGTDENGDIIRENCTGNGFTPRARNIIKGLKSGDIITFEDIWATGPDGKTRHLPSLLYNIN